MPKYSIVLPVYNRPDEVAELLPTLVNQTFQDFEVVVVEDGSTKSCESVVAEFQSKLNIHYYRKKNGGQGFARNFGFERATGDFLLVFDSDCLIPAHYLQTVDDFLTKNPLDAFGGPDAAHPSFTTVQRAISQSLTSVLTTGGIRGSKQHVGIYHPRSFNMGISRRVYEATNGYLIPFMGEDLEFSTRIIKLGFKTGLIPEAYVYHKRRTNIRAFYKQMRYFGRARINLTRFHADQLSIIHLFPLIFTLGWLASGAMAALQWKLGSVLLACYGGYLLLVLFEALVKQRSLQVALLTPCITLIQMWGYGFGLLYEWIQKRKGIDPNAPYIDLYR